jgi:hypothetical protein
VVESEGSTAAPIEGDGTSAKEDSTRDAAAVTGGGAGADENIVVEDIQ